MGWDWAVAEAMGSISNFLESRTLENSSEFKGIQGNSGELRGTPGNSGELRGIQGKSSMFIKFCQNVDKLY